MKEWMTAREIAAEALPDMPGSERGIAMLAARQGWDIDATLARPRAGRGGGMEYHFHLLPVLAQVAYAQKHMRVEKPAASPAAPQTATDLSGRAAIERDARLAVVAAFIRFGRGLQLGETAKLQVFCDKYNAGRIAVDDWVRRAVPAVSKRSLIRWQSARRAGKRIGHDPAQSRKGTGILETANGGKVRAFILGLIAHQPHLSAAQVRTQCRAEFGYTIEAVSKGVRTTVEMPPVRTFQHALKGLKADHRVELIKLTNPDQYRSTLAISGTGTLAHVTEANQLWQIDASPMDALCTDGRHSIYGCIDIATRRTIWQVSRTPRASAVALLIRKAILAWGVPETIKTDNGSDFAAKDTQRLFASLGIEAIASDAYSPQQKGHIERAIGTMQRDLAPLLPGFVGHSVADRKAIESRKSFAQRLGESEAETFGVTLTGAALQAAVDQWANDVYAHAPHAGLKGGTPFKAALASSATMRTVDERALDLLLMPVAGGDGRRRVTKFGIRIDHHHYSAPTILPGTDVFVRMDPNDLGRAFAFAEDGGTFLGEAICPTLRGIHPKTFMKAAKEIHRAVVDNATAGIKAEMKRIAKGPALIERALDVARRDAPNVIPLPKRTEAHSTSEIAAALDAMSERLNPTRELNPREAAEHRRLIEEMTRQDEAQLHREVEAMLKARQDEIEAARTAHLPKDEKIVALPETPKERYRRAVIFDRQVKAGACRPEDAVWLGGYQLSAEFKSYQGMHADFGDEWLES